MAKKKTKPSPLALLAIPFTPLGLVVFLGIYAFFGLPRWTLFTFIAIQISYFAYSRLKDKK